MKRRLAYLLMLVLAAAAVLLTLNSPARLLNRYTPHSSTEPQEWMALYGYVADERQPFTFNPDGHGRVVLPRSQVNGVQMALFLDTGNGHGLVVPQKAATAAGWQPVGEQRSVAGGVERGDLPLVVVSSVRLGSWALTANQALVADEPMGYVGWAPFGQNRITLDYEHEVIATSNLPLPAAVTSGPQRLVARYVTPREGGLSGSVLLPVKVNGIETLAILDTGAAVSVIDPALAEKLGLKANLLGRVRLESLQVGPFDLAVRSASIRPQALMFRGVDEPVYMTLGADVLNRFLVTFDFGSGRVVLER